MPFFIKFSFKIFPVHRMFSIIKVRKTHRRICRRLFFKKGEGCSLKRDSGASAFLWVLRNFKERLFSSTYVNCYYWNLGISLRRGILCKVHIEEMNSFLQHFGIHSFQIDFRIFHNLRAAFRTIWNISDETFSRCIFAETFHQRYWARF